MSDSSKDPFKLSKKGKPAPIPTAIAYDSLLAKSKLCAKRSLEAKEAGFDVETQLWAAMALELLAKAQLARIHPSLIVEVENPNSLLEANGIPTGTVIRTINASVAYARLKHTVTHFSTPVHDECKKLAERRNAELHSGSAACAAMPPEAWEGDFWNAADLILSSMDLDLKEWLGAGSDAPKNLLKNHREAEKKAAIQRVKHHAALFKKSPMGKLGTKKFEELVKETGAIDPQTHMKQFHYLYTKYWHYECPSCGTFGVAAGDQEWEELADDQSGADYGWQIVERSYSPSEFHCPVCQLSLVGDTAVHAVGITDSHVEEDEEEVEYEPDYGND
jgi:hypothetical protein